MRKKSETISSNIRWLMDQFDVTHGEMAAAIGVGRNTLTNRFKDPSSFTLGEIRRAAAFFKVDATTLIDGKLG